MNYERFPREQPVIATAAHLPTVNMNKTEAAYFSLLEADPEVELVIFEGIKLRLGHKCFYTPDFLVVLRYPSGRSQIECHEVKGFWRDDARVKIKAAAAKFYMLRFVAARLVKGRWEIEEIKP